MLVFLRFLRPGEKKHKFLWPLSAQPVRYLAKLVLSYVTNFSRINQIKILPEMSEGSRYVSTKLPTSATSTSAQAPPRNDEIRVYRAQTLQRPGRIWSTTILMEYRLRTHPKRALLPKPRDISETGSFRPTQECSCERGSSPMLPKTRHVEHLLVFSLGPIFALVGSGLRRSQRNCRDISYLHLDLLHIPEDHFVGYLKPRRLPDGLDLRSNSLFIPVSSLHPMIF